MKFEVWDKVRVRKDLEAGKRYGLIDYINLMGFKGNVVTIEKVNLRTYKLKEDPHKFNWDESMFEKLKPEYIMIKEKTLKKYQDKASKSFKASVALAIENMKLMGQVEAYEKVLKIKEEK